MLFLLKVWPTIYVKQFTPSLPDFSALHPVRVIAAAFNLLTAQQPWAAERLARHAGQTVRIALGGFSVTLTIDSEGRLTRSDPAVVPDVTLEIIAEKLTAARLFATKSPAGIAELIHISGQASLANLVSELARDLRPEPEDALASVVGDLPAQKLVRGVQGLAHSLLTMTKGLAHNTAEYFAEETNALAGQPALAMHRLRQKPLEHRIDDLSERQQGLLARIERLASKKRRAA